VKSLVKRLLPQIETVVNDLGKYTSPVRRY
jgi:hypothetical protein